MLLNICLKMFKNERRTREYSVRWTNWDSNREYLKFDEIGKPSSSTIITAINYRCIVSGKCTARNSY